MGKENKLKYEFHVGDYVETKDGQIGYITTFIHTHDGENSILVNYRDGRTQGYKFYKDELLRYFNRIGQYDFTKKDEGKIEFIDGVDTTNPIDSPFIIDKINELIEAVNELREKVYE